MMTSRLAIADALEREQALNPYQSFIVQAPAGSGKTGLLVKRYLRLLSVVERPESIVAITFTRKAAAEMKTRVEDALRSANEDAPSRDSYDADTRKLAREALQNSRKHNWHLLADTGRLQIQTIDSLCALLTRQMPIVSEFGGTSDVIEDARELYRRAARRTIRNLAEGDDCNPALFRRLSLHFDNDIACLEGQIAGMLGKRDQWRFLKHVADDETLVSDFCQLLELARQSLRQVFREHSAVDFTEVTRAAIKALGTPEHPSDLLYSLDYRIEHLLVDEFQDTSRAQYELLKALTGQWSEGDSNHTLFLVGDPMQSIYRFREAEVGLFIDAFAREQLGAVRLIPIRLVTNFRSTPEIVNWTHATLGAVMPEDDAAQGAVQFQPSEAARPEAGFGPKLFPFVDDSGAPEAREIVQIIQRSQGKGEIAILVRSRAHITSILPALRNAGIPYEAIEIDELKTQQHILDLLSLTRALLHVGDRVSWLACLRAPWCGLTLADFSALAEQPATETIFDLLSDPERIVRLSPDGRQRAIDVQELFEAALEQVGRVRLRTLVERLWLALGGPAVLRGENQYEDVNTLLDLIEAFEEGGVIRDFSLLKERLDILYAQPHSGANRVRVMTVHSAKGLEFDVVIIPKAAASTRSSDRDLIIWTEVKDQRGETGLKLAALPQRAGSDPNYKSVFDENEQKESHELKRLFYVACTRAKNELYLLGNVKSKKGGTEPCKASSKSFLGLIWPTVEAAFASELRGRFSPAANKAVDAKLPATTLLRRLPVSWKTPPLDSSVRWASPLRTATASEHEIPYIWVSDTGRHVGSVVHELLKRVGREGWERWTQDRFAALAPLVASELKRLGVAATALRSASDTVIRALRNTLGSERGRWILRLRPDAQSEWPIGGRLGDQVISGTVDRMFRDEQDRLWVIDFKISEHEGSRPEQFLNQEKDRYRAQLETYGTLISRLNEAPVWLGLYFPLLDGWREWQLQKEAIFTPQYTGV